VSSRVSSAQHRTEQPARAAESARVLPTRPAASHSPTALFQQARANHGTPLDAAAARLMESRFGASFGAVRIHNDQRASAFARALDARAVTRGQDIYFAAGAYQPTSQQGQRLLAHELTHTIQQRNQVALQPSLTVSQPGDRYEAQADSVAAQVVAGRSLRPGRITPAAAGAINAFARQAATATPPRPAPETTLLDPARMLDRLADIIARNIQADPTDRSGRVRQQIQRLAPATRESVLERLQMRLTSSQWDQLSALLAEPAPDGSQLAAPDAEAAAETNDAVQDTQPEPSQPAQDAQTETPQPAQDATEASAAPDITVKQDGEATPRRSEDQKPVAPDELPPVDEPGSAVPEVDASQAEAAATKPGKPAPGTAEAKPPAAQAGAAPVSSPGAQAVPAPPASAVEDEGPGGAAVAPTEDAASTDDVPDQEAAPSEQEQEQEQAQQTAAEPTANVAVAPPPPVAEIPDNAPPVEDVPEPSPETLDETVSGEASAPEEVESEPEPAGDEQQAEDSAPVAAPQDGESVDAGATDESGNEATAEPQGADAEGAAAAGPADAAPLTQPTPDPPDPACGGGGQPIPDPEQPPAPNVAQADPAQAMQAVGTLPPSQMQAALGQVSQSASSEVNAERGDLKANPPQMERPSGVPANRDAASPPAALPPMPPDIAPTKVDKTAAGQAIPVPGPPPLPAQPPVPTQAATTPRLPGESQLSEQDVREVQTAVDKLPTTDPALNVTAGDAPHLQLEGNADPTRVHNQRSAMDTSVKATEAQGYKDITAPFGENNVYPHVPRETLKAGITAATAPTNGATALAAAPAPAPAAPAAQAASANGKAPAPAPAGGGGAAGGDSGGVDERSVSAIAQEKRGSEIRAAVNKGRADMVAKKKEHVSKVSDERTRSQKEIDDLVKANGEEQTKARDNVRKDVQRERRDWDKDQRGLVGDAKTEAEAATGKAETDLNREQTDANKQSTAHINEGNKEITDARREGEEKARKKRAEAEKESSSGGFFSWLGSKITSFFNKIKDAIHAAFDFARKLVRAAIEKAQRLAMAVIEAARKAVVGIIEKVGDALIAIGDRVLAGFPALRDRFRKAIKEKVQQATALVNKLADKLKAGVKAALDLLGKALNGLLTLLESVYMAAIDVVANAIKSAIDFAKAVIQALAEFAVLIRDISAGPGKWLANLGTSIIDGIRNCLWAAFKRAVREWFNQKVQEVLGLGLAVWNLLKKGGISIAQIGMMAWEGVKAAIPPTLAQILVEKLVAMIVPAAGAILAIVEGLRAAWGTISRIITAFQRFFAFLKSVKDGGPKAAGNFAEALAAAAVVVIDFAANWLIARLGKAFSAVAGKLGNIASRIGAGLKRVGAVAKRGIAAVRRGVSAVGRGIARGARAVGRGAARVGRAVARSRVGRYVGRGVNRARALVQRGKERFQKFRERRRANRKVREQQRQDRAFASATATLNRQIDRGASLVRIRLTALALRVRHRFHTMRVQASGGNLEIDAGFSPAKRLTKAQRETLERAAAEAEKGQNVHAAVPVRLLTRTNMTIGELVTVAQRTEFRNIVRQGLEESNRTATVAAVSTIVNRVLNARITAISGTRKLRTLYGRLYTDAFGDAKGEIHHLIPLYLGGSHETKNLLDLGDKLHDRVHAIFRKIGESTGFSLSPGTLLAQYGVSGRWAIAIIYSDGRIRYREVRFVRK
jgi:hypothetical protein